MKQYTHAWLAFKAIEKLENIKLSAKNQKYAKSLIKWFKQYNDSKY